MLPRLLSGNSTIFIISVSLLVFMNEKCFWLSHQFSLKCAVWETGGRLFHIKTGHQIDPKRPWSHSHSRERGHRCSSHLCMRSCLRVKFVLLNERAVREYLVPWHQAGCSNHRDSGDSGRTHPGPRFLISPPVSSLLLCSGHGNDLESASSA